MFKRTEKHITDSEAIRNLPHNRKEAFFDLLKNRKMTMFVLSCYVFMFFIPLAVDLFLFNYLESMAIASGKSEDLFSWVFYSMAIMVPCMMIGFLGFAGAFYVAKKMVWQDGISVAVDFFNGIKDNWKRAVLNGLLFGLFLFGLVVGGSYLYIYSPASPIWCGVGIGALILLFLVFGMVVALNLTQDVYYSNGIFATLKNSFCFLGLLNWKVIVLFILSTGAVFTLCCFNMITLAIGMFLFAILNSVVIILYTLISHSAFDKYINKEHYPDMVGKGLYKKLEDKEA
ncbi:MAG: hypothetical protein IJR08_02490 [Bacilli bacterium]|nr:hypothetical protein [Bacilli bacterium]